MAGRGRLRFAVGVAFLAFQACPTRAQAADEQQAEPALPEPTTEVPAPEPSPPPPPTTSKPEQRRPRVRHRVDAGFGAQGVAGVALADTGRGVGGAFGALVGYTASFDWFYFGPQVTGAAALDPYFTGVATGGLHGIVPIGTYYALRLDAGLGAGGTTHESVGGVAFTSGLGFSASMGRWVSVGVHLLVLSVPRTHTGHFGAAVGLWL